MKYAKLAASALAPKRMAGGQCWRFFCAGIAALVATVFLCAQAQAEDLHPRLETARDGHNLIAALHIVIPAEFHAYGHEPGEVVDLLRARLGADFAAPIFIDNTNRYQAIAESAKGVAGDCRNFIIVDALPEYRQHFERLWQTIFQMSGQEVTA